MKIQTPAAVLLGLALATSTFAQDDSSPEDLSLREALGAGKSWVKMRLRFENVDQDGNPDQANAFTLRTLLGYETATWNDFSLLLEAEDVATIGQTSFNDGLNGSSRPKVIDPEGAEVNQAYLQYTGFEDTTVRIGRQRIILDKARFVGNVGWRQNEQTYDAQSVSTEISDFDLFLAHIDNVNRIFGDANPGGNHAMDSYLLHAGYDFEDIGRLEAFLYDLSYDDTSNGPSTRTVGASFDGRHEVSEETDVLYRVVLANQTDAHDNPVNVDAGYMQLEAGVDFDGITVKVGQELLEGSGDPGDKFTTPLATLHAWNGWADQFLSTPDTGLEDTYISIGGTLAETKMALIYHDFQSDTGGLNYGDEIDAVATRQIYEGVTGGLKLANYSADDLGVDTQKVWIWVAFTF